MSARPLFTTLLLLTACGADAPTPPAAGDATATSARATIPVQNRDVAALAAALPSAPVVLDVRTAEEFGSGHVPGARNIPLDQLESRISELESYRDAEVWTICQSGRRSVPIKVSVVTLIGHRFALVAQQGTKIPATLTRCNLCATLADPIRRISNHRVNLRQRR